MIWTQTTNNDEKIMNTQLRFALNEYCQWIENNYFNSSIHYLL